MTPGPRARRRAGRIGLLRGAVLLQASLLLLGAEPLGAQGAGAETTDGRVMAARLDARVPAAGSDDGTTEVEIGYRVVADRTVERIPLKALAFFGVTPTDVRVTVEGEAAGSGLDPSRPPLLSGGVRLDRPARAGDTLDLVVSYGLPAAIPATGGGFDIVLPVLFVDWKPVGAPEDFFEATVRLPAAYSVEEAFPTVPKETRVRDGTRRYDFRLQTVPSLIRFRGEEGDPPFFTFSRLVDLGVVLILVLGGAFGWRALRRERARADAGQEGGRR